MKIVYFTPEFYHTTKSYWLIFILEEYRVILEACVLGTSCLNCVKYIYSPRPATALINRDRGKVIMGCENELGSIGRQRL